MMTKEIKKRLQERSRKEDNWDEQNLTGIQKRFQKEGSNESDIAGLAWGQ